MLKIKVCVLAFSQLGAVAALLRPPPLALERLEASHGLGVHCSIAAHPPSREEEAEQFPLVAPIAQLEPDFQFDQTVSW